MIRSIHRFVSELKSTFCRFVITEPGLTPSHPERNMNQATAHKPMLAARSCLRAGHDGLTVTGVTDSHPIARPDITERDSGTTLHHFLRGCLRRKAGG